MLVPDERYEIVKGQLKDIARLIGTDRNQVSGDKVSPGPGLGLTEESSQLKKRADELEKGCFKVACVGFISGGKTTLVESLQGRRMDSRATGIAATTSVITQTIYGKTETAEIHEMGKKPETIPHSKFWQDYTLPEADNLKDIGFAVLKYNTPIHRMGFSLVDTRGFARTAESAQNLLKTWDLDAVLLVLDSRTIFITPNKEEALVNFVFGKVPNKKNIFLVINDFNMKDSEKNALNKGLRNMFKEHFNKDGTFDEDLFAHRMFIVNADSALNAKLEGTGGDALEKTGLPALERELKALNEYNLEATVKLVSDTLGSARKEILSQRDSLFKDWKIYLENIKKKLNTVYHEANRIQKSSENLVREQKERIDLIMNTKLPAVVEERRRLLKSLGQTIPVAEIHRNCDKIDEEVKSLWNTFSEDHKKQTDVFTESMTEPQEKIKSEFKPALEEKHKEAATELQRLKDIDTALTEHFREIVHNVYGDLTPEELAARGLYVL